MTLGVDSLHNCSGAQSGALAPENGMFWAWNTGYIFLKMEGTAPASKQPDHLLEYHIGGYRTPNNAIRTVTLPFKAPLLLGERPSRLTLEADVAQLFKSPTVVDFEKLSSVTDFHHATMIADNYTTMWRIVGVGNE
jgi:hypothetical protein